VDLSPEAFLDGVTPAFSDDALAQRLADRHADDTRYVAAWGQWFGHNGKVWQQDGTLHAYDEARKICRAASAECNGTEAEKKGLASAKTVAAVVSLARSDRRMAATIDQWDADPWVLNTPDGVIDLRTGKMKLAPHTKPVPIDNSFVADPRGGPEKVIGNRGHLHVKGDRPQHTR